MPIQPTPYTRKGEVVDEFIQLPWQALRSKAAALDKLGADTTKALNEAMPKVEAWDIESANVQKAFHSQFDPQLDAISKGALASPEAAMQAQRQVSALSRRAEQMRATLQEISKGSELTYGNFNKNAVAKGQDSELTKAIGDVAQQDYLQRGGAFSGQPIDEIEGLGKKSFDVMQFEKEAKDLIGVDGWMEMGDANWREILTDKDLGSTMFTTLDKKVEVRSKKKLATVLEQVTKDEGFRNDLNGWMYVHNKRGYYQGSAGNLILKNGPNSKAIKKYYDKNGIKYKEVSEEQLRNQVEKDLVVEKLGDIQEQAHALSEYRETQARDKLQGRKGAAAGSKKNPKNRIHTNSDATVKTAEGYDIPEDNTSKARRTKNTAGVESYLSENLTSILSDNSLGLLPDQLMTIMGELGVQGEITYDDNDNPQVKITGGNAWGAIAKLSALEDGDLNAEWLKNTGIGHKFGPYAKNNLAASASQQKEEMIRNFDLELEATENLQRKNKDYANDPTAINRANLLRQIRDGFEKGDPNVGQYYETYLNGKGVTESGEVVEPGVSQRIQDKFKGWKVQKIGFFKNDEPTDLINAFRDDPYNMLDALKGDDYVLIDPEGNEMDWVDYEGSQDELEYALGARTSDFDEALDEEMLKLGEMMDNKESTINFTDAGMKTEKHLAADGSVVELDAIDNEDLRNAIWDNRIELTFKWKDDEATYKEGTYEEYLQARVETRYDEEVSALSTSDTKTTSRDKIRKEEEAKIRESMLKTNVKVSNSNVGGSDMYQYSNFGESGEGVVIYNKNQAGVPVINQGDYLSPEKLAVMQFNTKLHNAEKHATGRSYMGYGMTAFSSNSNKYNADDVIKPSTGFDAKVVVEIDKATALSGISDSLAKRGRGGTAQQNQGFLDLKRRIDNLLAGDLSAGENIVFDGTGQEAFEMYEMIRFANSGQASPALISNLVTRLER